MFKRILHEEWAAAVPIVAFLITFTFFVVMMVKAARMKKSQRERLAHLPLDEPSNALAHTIQTESPKP